MQYTDDRHHLRVQIEAKQCNIPQDELTRMERTLSSLGEEVEDFPTSDLSITVIRHPRSQDFHVEAKLQVPGRSLRTGDTDIYLDSAFDRCTRKLVQKVRDYKAHPDWQAIEQARKEINRNQDVAAPGGTDMGPLGEAVAAGDYQLFRNLLINYESWIRRRVGRWIERYPKAQALVGNGLSVGDLVEEVYLNAFEHYRQRPTEVPFHQWLEQLLDPSLQAMLRHPGEESMNASFARSLRDL
jgi:ribosome-associated translation inhibitor RaiA